MPLPARPPVYQVMPAAHLARGGLDRSRGNAHYEDVSILRTGYIVVSRRCLHQGLRRHHTAYYTKGTLYHAPPSEVMACSWLGCRVEIMVSCTFCDDCSRDAVMAGMPLVARGPTPAPGPPRVGPPVAVRSRAGSAGFMEHLSASDDPEGDAVIIDCFGIGFTSP